VSAFENIGQKVDSLACNQCGVTIDVSGAESFSQVLCPSCGAQQTVPRKLGQFLLLRFLGKGGMGAVFQGFDPKLGRQVAVKILGELIGDDPESLKNFMREARSAAQINSPNVVQIYSVGEEEDQPFIIMELINGGQLDNLIESEPLDELKALYVCRDASQGLLAAQEIGLFHGDIKPENILFDQHGIAKLADFGLAQFLHRESQTQKGEIWGTPYYIAPEKARRQQEDYRSDIYSLGATLFHIITGEPPFEGDTPTDVVLARLRELPPDIRDINPYLHPETAELVNRMLEPDPMKRYPNYPSLISDIDDTIAAVKQSREHPATEATAKKRKRIITLFLVIALLLVGGLALLFVGADDEIFDEKQDHELTSQIRIWAKRSYRYDASSLSAVDKKLGRFYKTLPADHDGRNWVALVQGSIQALAMNTNAARDTFEKLASGNLPEAIDGEPNQAFMPQQIARFFISTNEDFSVKTALWPYWYGALTDYFAGIKYLSQGDYEEGQKSLQSYLRKRPRKDDPVWPYSFRPIAETLVSHIKKWNVRQERISICIERHDYNKAQTKLQSYEIGTPPVFMPYVEANRQRLDALQNKKSDSEKKTDTEVQNAAEEERKAREKEERAAKKAEKKRKKQEEKERIQKEKQEQDQASDAARITAFIEQTSTEVKARRFDAMVEQADWLTADMITNQGRQNAQIIQTFCKSMQDLQELVIQNIGQTKFAKAITKKLGGLPLSADQNRIILGLTHGQAVKAWSAIKNGLYIKIAETSIRKAKISKDAKAEFYVTLALFCKRVGGPDGWTLRYVEKARKINAAIVTEREAVLDLFGFVK